MGAIFSVPVARVREVGELPGRRVALAAREGRRLAELEEGDVTLLVGAEREGLPDDVLAECDEVCHIPIRSESLNAAMAATVAMYEVSR
jgi:TrmH family RNA methyltransferase